MAKEAPFRMHVKEHDKCRFDLVAIHVFCTRCGIDISPQTVTFKAKLVTETAAVDMKPVAFESHAPVVERMDQGRTAGYIETLVVWARSSKLPCEAFGQKDFADLFGVGPFRPTSASNGVLSTQGTDLGVRDPLSVSFCL